MPFVDGNKPTARVVSEAFLRLNGFRVGTAPEDTYLTLLRLAEARSAKSIWLPRLLSPRSP
jgi:prophage maintenance system killer protein